VEMRSFRRFEALTNGASFAFTSLQKRAPNQQERIKLQVRRPWEGASGCS
jgi:hypothetical protein